MDRTVSRGSERKLRVLSGLLDLAAANAGGANAQTARGAFHQRANGVQIQIPAALGNIMSVADAVPESRPAAAQFANLSHENRNLLRKSTNLIVARALLRLQTNRRI